MMRVPAALLVLAGLAAGSPAPAHAQLAAEIHVSGLSAPVNFVQHPLDPDVQLVVELGGRIRVVRNGVIEGDFLDLSGSIASGGERGLFSIVFAPDFATSGRVFVNFTNPDGHTVVARFHTLAGALAADPSSRFDLRWSGEGGARFIAQPFANHNGGHMAFGPDGYLYIGMGDGGSGNDPLNHAQDPSTLLGKMLRIDVDVSDADADGYVVPPDNPFVGTAARPEIWAFGLRNPWRFSFDQHGGSTDATGALVIGDVGQGAWEEVDYEPAGAGGRNYGWRIREGAHDYITTLPPATLPLVDPILEYDRSVGRSVTGGYVYRGSALGASYAGRYFYADFVFGRLWSVGLTIDGAGEATAGTPVEHTDELGGALGNISSFGVDAGGELYVLSFNGVIFKIVAADDGPPPSTGECPGTDPFAALGGGTCVGGNWYPPGHPGAGGSTPPPPPPPPPPSTTDCPGTDPFVALGGGTCVNGNWYPPGYPVPTGDGGDGDGGDDDDDPPAPPPPPSTDCPGTDPFAALGGGTCVNGNWLPPGHPDAAGGTPPPPPPPPSSDDCPGTDPFEAIAGLIGQCVNGNWLPVEGVRSMGTMHAVETAGGTVWTILAGETYEIVGTVGEEFAVEGLSVAFEGAFTGGSATVDGAVPITLLSISLPVA